MSAVLNPVEDAGRAIDAQAKQSELLAHAVESLRAEFLDALTGPDPQRVVRTPGYGTKEYGALYCVIDEMDSNQLPSVAFGIEMLRVISDAAKGEDVQLRASAWLAAMANCHAKYHADFLVAEMEDAS